MKDAGTVPSDVIFTGIFVTVIRYLLFFNRKRPSAKSWFRSLRPTVNQLLTDN